MKIRLNLLDMDHAGGTALLHHPDSVAGRRRRRLAAIGGCTVLDAQHQPDDLFAYEQPP